MKRSLLKIKTIELQLFLIFTMGMSYLYLIDEKASIAGISFADIALVVSFTWSVWWLYKLRNKKVIFTYKYWMIALFFLVFLSAFQSYRLNGQSILLGIRPQRRLLFWAFLYFPLTKLIICKKITRNEIITLIKYLGLISLFLFILQYFSYQKIVFLSVLARVQTRGLRLYVLPTLLDLLFMIELDEFIRNKGSRKIEPMMIIGLILFEVTVVQKFRMTSLALLVCLGLFFFVEKNSSGRKLTYIIIGVAAVLVLLNTPYFQNIFDTISSGGDTLTIRESGRLLYFNVLAQHPFLGGGYPHQTNANSAAMAGSDLGVYLVDNGLVGLAYVYGAVGAFWFVSLWVKLLKGGWRKINNAMGTYHFMFPLLFIISGLTEAHWYWEYGFLVFVLFLSLEESDNIERL